MFDCVLFFSCLVFCAWLSFVLFSSSSRSHSWFLPVWVFAFVVSSTIACVLSGILLSPCSFCFVSLLVHLSCFFASPSRIFEHLIFGLCSFLVALLFSRNLSRFLLSVLSSSIFLFVKFISVAHTAFSEIFQSNLISVSRS